MTAFLTRVLISALVVATASIVARRQPALGSLIVSLPLISVLTMIWLWRDGAEPTTLADFIGSTFWFFLPSMPMFLLMPALLRRGMTFWPALGIGCVTTILLYLLMVSAAARFGLRIDR